jgi:stage II sporulation protein M
MLKGIYTLYRWPVLVLLVVFGFGLVLGVVLPVEVKILILQAVAEKFGGILADSPTTLSLSWNIFLNNLTVALLLYGSGFFVILPAVIVFGNGALMGVFLSLLYRSDTLQPGQFLSSMIALLPHGIFELSAFFLVGVLSIVVIMKTVFHKYIEPTKSRLRALWESAWRFVIIIVPLLMVAALVETYISPRLAAGVQTWWVQRSIDPNLAVALNQVGLAEHGCTVSTTAETNQELATISTLDYTAGFTTLANVLYNEPLYSQLRTRQAVPFWEETIYCTDDQVMTIQAWPSEQWSQGQAAALARNFLVAGGLTYEEYSSTGRNRFTYTMNDVAVAQTLVTISEKTVAVTQSNSDFTVNEIFLDTNLTTPQ